MKRKQEKMALFPYPYGTIPWHLFSYIGEENMDASEESERKGKTEIERGVGDIGF